MILKEKKKIKDLMMILLVYVSTILLTAYTFPADNTPYLVVDCNFGNNFIIAFPANQVEN